MHCINIPIRNYPNIDSLMRIQGSGRAKISKIEDGVTKIDTIKSNIIKEQSKARSELEKMKTQQMSE